MSQFHLPRTVAELISRITEDGGVVGSADYSKKHSALTPDLQSRVFFAKDSTPAQLAATWKLWRRKMKAIDSRPYVSPSPLGPAGRRFDIVGQVVSGQRV